MKQNRRQILASLGLIGAGGLVGGGATAAYFSDEESVTTVTAAGNLDIQLDWKAIHNGEQIALQEPTDVNGQVAASFTDVKPGDTGCFSLSIHNETNPAWVWLAMDITDETDGGENGTGDKDCPVTQYPWVCGRNETDGNVTVSTQDDELVVEVNGASGKTLEETHLHIANSTSGIPSGGGGPIPGQFEYSHENISSNTDKYEIPFSQEEVSCGDDIVIAVHAADNEDETCWAGSTEFPGANWAVVINHTICCPNGSSSSSGNSSDLADNILVDIFWDFDEDCEIDSDEIVLFKDITLKNLANNISKSTGGIMPQWYTTGTKFLSLAWRIPSSVGNEIENDTLDLEFNVYAEQRRHNSNPDNPWT